MNDQPPQVSAATAGVFASNPRAIRLLLANDEQNFFDGLRTRLASEFAVAITRARDELLHRARDHQPDIILFGDWQPGQETASLLPLKALPRPPKLLVVVDHDDEDISSAVLAAGADACLSKAQFSTQWRSVIRNLTLPS